MWAISLRLRFFIVILIVLSVVIGTSIALREFFLHQTKVDLIDDQLRSMAALIVNSDLAQLKAIDFEKIDRVINEELGEGQIGKFFIVRDGQDQVVFESSTLKNHSLMNYPRATAWSSIEEGDNFVRILNLELPRWPDRYLQVGIIVKKGLLLSDLFDRQHLMFRGMIFMSGLLMAWFLVSTLLSPISKLARFVSSVAIHPEQRMEIPALPADLKRTLQKKPFFRDELDQLLAGFEAMTDRINRDYRISRFWSYQMAHELKTPMALMEAKITEAQRSNEISAPVARDLLFEIFEVSETITSFLTWAEVENSSEQKKRLFAAKASSVVGEIQKRLEVGFPGRLQLKVIQDFYVLANTQHLEQVMNNLVVNALLYSSPEAPVVVELKAHQARVIDKGRGFSATVLERLGEPFNKGENPITSKRRGSGLGLALVQSVCNLYGWKIEIKSSPEGSAVSIDFPETHA